MLIQLGSKEQNFLNYIQKFKRDSAPESTLFIKRAKNKIDPSSFIEK